MQSINAISFLITVPESWDALGENVTDHEFFATRWLLHHHSAFWSKSVVDNAISVTFQGDFTAGAIFEGAVVSVPL